MALLTDWLSGDNWATIKTKTSDLFTAFNTLFAGTTGQMLVKSSNTDFDWEWVDQPTAPDYDPGEWQDLTLNSGYTTASVDSGSEAKLQYRIDSNDIVTFKGRLTVGSIATNEVNSVAIPVGYRPLVPKIINASNYGASQAESRVIVVQTSGIIQIIKRDGSNLSSGAISYFDMVQYSVN